jgi:hypothetical protein
VVDSAPPVVSCPANVVSECVAGLGVGINLGRATASDLCGTATVPTNDGRAPWRLGVTNVTYTSHDAGGRVGSCRQTVSVVDTTPPRLAAVTAAPPVLVAGAMRDVTVVAVATDSCDVTPLPTCSIESITSAPVAPAADIAINAPLRASLRAVRGRQYTLNVVCKDRAGLSARAAATARTL